MAGAKFFIYGGFRWREIDTNSGRVSGWGDVQFVTARRGRLEVARKSAVLRGLRSLAENKPTSVQDGLQLSQKRQWDAIENKKNALDGHHHCCCHQQNVHRNSDANHNKIPTNTAAVQCSISNKLVLSEQNNIETRSKSPILVSEIESSEQDITSKTDHRLISKRKRSVSDDEYRESEKRIGKSKKSKNKKRILDISLSEHKRSQEIQKPTYVVKKMQHGKILVKKQNLSISSKYRNNNNYNNKLSERELSRSKRKHSTSEDDSQDVVIVKNSLSERSKYTSISNLNYDRNKKLRQSRKLSSMITSDDERKASSKADRTLSKNEVIRKDSPRKASSSLNVKETDDRRKSLRNEKLSRKKNINESIASTQTQNDPCKELFISEDDVMLLRTFIEKDERNIFGVDLERFDTDDNYKSMIFYTLNPLVNVTRCRKIAEMLKDQRSQCNSVSLKDFISTLGLQSILDTSSQKSSKYKMRARKSRNETPDKAKTGSETDKENSMAKSNRKKTKVDKVLIERIKKTKRIGDKKKAVGLLGQMTSRPRRKYPELLRLSSDSDSVFEKSKQVSPVLVKKMKPVLAVKRAVRRTGKAGREYSRAEDEAIVEWLRGAGRARRVNGNQLWRELQPVHHQTTGQFRSWHSLRNRYLRYVLPALGALAVTPQEAARLRADAAAGEMKSRKQPQRRNSLILQPRVQSAWSRRPRPPRESTPPTPSPPRDTRSLPPTRAPSSSTSARPTSVDSNYSSHSVVDSGKDTSSGSTPSRRVNTRSSNVKSVTKESTTRTLRSSAAGVSPIRANTRADIHVPTYSELTRRFASKHKDDTDSDAIETVNTETTDRQFTTRLRSSGQMDSTGRNSAGTDRHTASNERPRTRRLYNPKAI